MKKDYKISVVLPCRNEEKTIGLCIDKINKVLKGKDYEIIVSDSSTDKSADIAREKGVIVVKHDKVGYGNAYLEGFKKVTGDVIVMGDSDNTYDFEELPRLLEHIKNHDLIIGRRKFIHKKAMPFLHRYIGNPFLSFILRLFFSSKVKDTHSGFRVIRRLALEKLVLRTTGMEFASEMIIKAAINDLKIKEVPINYYKRVGHSKLQTFRDGWKHLRFMLLYSPTYLFFLPGMLMFIFGLIGLVFLSTNTLIIINFELGIHAAILSSLITILGFQLVFLTLYAKIYLYAILKEKEPFVELILKHLTIEKGIVVGGLVFLTGLVIGGEIVFRWLQGNLSASFKPGITLMASTILIIGLQLILNVFYLSILGIERTQSSK
ncbi:MAG: glycosyltransferase [Nanoarchaeota archaeon]|nr:glycosyltransferase [Nanoarchaeota archaeon]MBU1269830.1 glycosyltransferase [Nanoarchaeota archaeon]MBU1604885.1 glycosyltransferase [Nanoarchaeota archaeon]MBU2443162.1 glycosyltransferase [Nanoarchaeota archaeon]